MAMCAARVVWLTRERIADFSERCQIDIAKLLLGVMEFSSCDGREIDKN